MGRNWGGAWLGLVVALGAWGAQASPQLPGKFDVTASGTATYSIPLSVPPGTGGIIPTLSLDYSGDQGNGLLGIGWSLGGLPTIGRCPSNMAQDGAITGITYTASDRFCLNGQKLFAVSGTYGSDSTEYRLEVESFTRIVSYGNAGGGPAWFRVWTKAGQVMDFGATADSRIEAQGKIIARAWGLSRIRDTSGNYLSVSYIEDNANGQTYPTRIDYTGNDTGGVVPYASVRFVYETRPDITPLYEAGSTIKLDKRLKTIETYQAEAPVLRYNLSYQVSTNTGNSRLVAVKVCDPNGECLPSTNFGWQNQGTGFGASTKKADGLSSRVASGYKISSGEYIFYTYKFWENSNLTPRYFADVNGDGRADIVGFGDGELDDDTVNDGTYVSLATGTGFQTPQRWLSAFSQGNIIKKDPVLSTSPTAAWVSERKTPRRLADVNADGLPDIVGFHEYGVYVSLSAGGSFTASQRWTETYGIGAGWTDNEAEARHLSDVNGDGRADIVGFATDGVYVSLSTGTSFGAPQLWLGSIANINERSCSYGTDPEDNTYKMLCYVEAVFPRSLVDMNGDGRADIVRFDDDGIYVALSTGSSFATPQRWVAAFGTTHGYTSANEYPRTLADVNGDGKPDAVGFYTNGAYVSLNTGTSFAAPVLWLSNAFGTSQGWTTAASHPRHLADMNGDGRADVVGFASNGVYVSFSTGTSFAAPVLWLNGAFGSSQGWSSDSTFPRNLADVNGDGRPDIVGFKDGIYAAVANGPVVADQLASITSGLGARTEITYKPLTDSSVYTKGTGAAYPALDLQVPGYVVSEVNASNGIDGFYRSTYAYNGLRIHLQGRGSYGFASRTVTDVQTGIVQTTTYRQGHPYTGLVASEEKRLGSQLLNRAQNTYTATALGGTRYKVELQQSVEESWELNGTTLPAVTTSYKYDPYANPTEVKVSTADGYTKTTTNTYTNDVANWYLGRLTRSAVTSTMPSGVSATRTSGFAYDPTTGLLVQEVVEPDTPAHRLTTDYTRDAFGNITAKTISGADIATRTLSTVYDAQGRFPVRQVNALGHGEDLVHDPRFGGLTSQTGPNGLTTTWAYDGFGRKVAETTPEGARTVWTYQICGTGCTPATVPYTDGPPPYRVSTTTTHATSGIQLAPSSRTDYDVLLREIVKRTQRPDGAWIQVINDFDQKGRLTHTGLPYTLEESPTGWPTAWTIFLYDAIGRVIRETHPDESMRGWIMTQYAGLTTVVTNGLNQTRTTVRNSQGQVVETRDAQNNATTFAYDPFGNPKTITDAVGNVTRFEHDGRGRKTMMVDPDLGRIEYAYDQLDQLVWQKDAKNQVTTFSYDLLGRMTARHELGLTSTWTYDTAPHGIGKLAQATTNGGYARTHSYDALGRPAGVALTIGGNVYSYSASYDSEGRLTQVVAPSGLTLGYAYTATGALREVRDAASGTPVWTANTWDQEGRLAQTTFGNGITTTRQFDPLNGFLTNIRAKRTGDPTNTVQDLTYTWDALGNLKTRKDVLSNLSESFGYDNLNRLTRAAVAGGAVKTVSYDALGNITAKSDVGTYTYGPAGAPRPHAVLATTGAVNASFAYDDNGNMISGGGRALTWTAFDMPETITQGLETVGFAYDSEHGRIRQTSSAGEMLYLGAFGLRAERKESPLGLSQWNDQILVGDTLVAVRHARSDGQTTWRYAHMDHLGSPVAWSDETGTVVERLSYDAWGKRRHLDGSDDTPGALTSAESRGFTGHEHLDQVGLVHMNGRVYDPLLGRFLSADPIVQDAHGGQNLNRYAYVLNNPLALTDPSGLGFFSDLWKGIKGFFKDIRNIIAIAVVVAFQQWQFLPAISSLGISAPVANGIAGGAIAGGIQGGNLKSALTGAVTGGAFGAVGDLNLSGFQQAAAHSVAGGATSVIQGGDFRSGFLSAGMSSLAGPYVKQLDLGSIGEGVARAVIGGTAAEIGGGDFANGATTAAFAYLFNHVAHLAAAQSRGTDQGVQLANAAGGCDETGEVAGCGLGNAFTPNDGGFPTAGQTVGPRDLYSSTKTPNEGPPGTWITNRGSGQERLYGSDGKPAVDIDWDHNHGQGTPHAHNWSRRPDGGVIRDAGVPVSPWPKGREPLSK